MILLDGKKVRDEIAQTLRARIFAYAVKPKLAIVQIGDTQESATYIKQKKLFGESIGVLVEHVHLQETVSEQEVLAAIGKLNRDASVHGIIVQLPISDTLDKDAIIEAIAPQKDVDGLGSVNIKLLWENKAGGYIPATTRGILSLLAYYGISVAGKRVVIVGRSFLVGKPTALALLNADATVTVAHSKTVNCSEVTRSADILIIAAGKPHFIQKDDVREGQIVIDVGITAVTGEKLNDEVAEVTITGDVHFDDVKDIVGAISPVPGGVGPMTVASLFQNLVSAYERQNS
ncbi:MAG: bifunctional 5,10-methylenetetrahydrofolate dehydrogenase/5,10-methenyltetrahydrofolate cyclohydrolase [Candidatus Taylorbacteria bacterium]|nr:bifunctional 5,10-methylenetetrahydrofolate dehydrogenase/5,10-methenyltetrahydrofolate cyclohydrolase [Candidatus Taylorbacteria bacterium]